MASVARRIRSLSSNSDDVGHDRCVPGRYYRAVLGALRQWFSIARGRCPRCGSRLEKHVAVEESYTRSAYFPHSGGKARGYNLVTERREYEITPVYKACRKCGFRIHWGDLKTLR